MRSHIVIVQSMSAAPKNLGVSSFLLSGIGMMSKGRELEQSSEHKRSSGPLVRDYILKQAASNGKDLGMPSQDAPVVRCAGCLCS